MRITLIHPPALIARANYSTITQPPLGIAYLASAAREQGHETSVVDAVGEAISQFGRWERNERFVVQGLSLEQVTERIDPDTELIGVTCMFTHSWPMVREFIAYLRTRFPGVPLIAADPSPLTSLRSSSVAAATASSRVSPAARLGAHASHGSLGSGS